MTGKLAWKNIWRNRTRSIIFICAALFGIALAIFALNLMKSISEQRLEDAISIQTGHLQIHRPGFTDDREVTLFLEKHEYIRTGLSSVAGIEAFSERIVTNAMMASPENSLVGEVKGIRPEEETKISVLESYLIAGKWFDTELRSPALISSYMAEKLNLELHSKFILTLKNASGEIEGGAFRISGIFKTPNTPFDESTVLVIYDNLAEIADVHFPHEMALKLADPEQLKTVRQEVKEKLGQQYEVSDWKELLPELHAFSGFTDMVGMLFTIIILLGLGFGLLNTMNMIVQERTREIGMLRAIGQSRLAVFSLLMKEAGLMMLIGSILGVILGVLIVSFASSIGIDLGDGFGTLGIRDTIYPELHWEQLVMMMVMATVLTLIIAAIPAYKAFNIDPSEALKE